MVQFLALFLAFPCLPKGSDGIGKFLENEREIWPPVPTQPECHSSGLGHSHSLSEQ